MKPEVELVQEELLRVSQAARQLAEQRAEQIVRLAEVYLETLRAGGTLYFAGNGGCAAEAQHIAAEYLVRYRANRRSLPAIALNADTAVLTACANDLGFERVFERQVEALVTARDLLIVQSTSGESENLIRAVAMAKRKGARTVAVLGEGGGRVRELVDECLLVPSDHASHVQELQLAIQHVICGLIEAAAGA